MPPPPTPQRRSPEVLPRIIYYHQTHYLNSNFVSVLPLLQQNSPVTHIIIAAIHLNAPNPDLITLNNDPYDAPPHAPLWNEVRTLQSRGIKCLGMLGGACPGSFKILDADEQTFRTYYEPLRKMIAWCQFDGLDLDVEEPTSLPGIIRLIDYLKSDFGPSFLITLAPVASALKGGPHLSGFSYFDLEKAMGRHISWYNTQFYCGWGSMDSVEDYEEVLFRGWLPHKVVVGLVTNPANGAGWVHDELLRGSLGVLRDLGGFGGVFGWEWFNSVTAAGGQAEGPWGWARLMGEILGVDQRRPNRISREESALKADAMKRVGGSAP
ncbi:MAG: hypothetical protein M1819_006319 [Sarea resinae]|nr:MAG: hypothetical protein M1819_006319 [Sarea resinae]